MHVSLSTFTETEHKEVLYMKVWGPRASMFTQPLKSKVTLGMISAALDCGCRLLM